MQKIVEKWLLPTVMFLHIGIAVPLAYYLNIWVDEASTLHTTQNGIVQAYAGLFTEEKQAPFYFLLLSVWRSFDDSIFFARLFSVVCSVLAIVVFSRLADRIWQKRVALGVTTLFALHPYLLWASLEIRLYSLVILLSCLLAKFFVDGFLHDDSETDEVHQAQYLYAVSSVVALYTNYYLGFPLVGGLVALLVLKKWTAARRYLLLMLGVGVVTVPLFYVVRHQFADRVATFQEERSIVEALRIVWNHFLSFTLPTELFTVDEPTVVSIVRLWVARFAVLAAILWSIRIRFRDLDPRIMSFFIIATVAGAFLMFVYFQLGAGYTVIRHASIYFVPIFIFAYAAAIWLLPPGSRQFAFVLLFLLYGYSIYSLYPNLTKRGDWERVSSHIAKNESVGQPILVFPIYDTVAIGHYYRGPNQIVAGDKAFSFFSEAPTGSPKMYGEQIKLLISLIPPDAREIWMLTSDKCTLDLACLPLENFIDANYTVISTQDFYAERLRLLKRKTQ